MRKGKILYIHGALLADRHIAPVPLAKVSHQGNARRHSDKQVRQIAQELR